MGRQQITIRLPDELREQVQKKADDEGQSFNAELIILLLKGLEVEWNHIEIHIRKSLF